MILIVEESAQHARKIHAEMRNHGYSIERIAPDELYEGWLELVRSQIEALDLVVIGAVSNSIPLTRHAKRSFPVPVIATVSGSDPELAAALFDAGADDVVHETVALSELLKRLHRLNRSQADATAPAWQDGRLAVFDDGSEPLVNGKRMQLPRREQRILEFLAKRHTCRVTREQIFSAAYGLSEEDANETAVDTHLCRLRKKLKLELGYDPVSSLRHLGYKLVGGRRVIETEQAEAAR